MLALGGILGFIFNSQLYTGVFCLSLGFALVLIIGLVLGLIRKAQIKAEAASLIEDAQEREREIEESSREKVKTFTEELENRADEETKKIERRIELLEARIKEREEKLENNYFEKEKNASEYQSEVDSFDNKVKTIEARVTQKRQTLATLRQQLIDKLTHKTQTSLEVVKSELQSKLLSESNIEAAKSLQTHAEEWQMLAEVEAKKLLTLTINRFARAYCPERGIGYLNFENAEQKARVLGKDHENLRLVEKFCGVDLSYDEINDSVNVSGFDPVRRELARSTVEKLMSEKNITSEVIEKIVAKNKVTLFQRIQADGQRISNELHLDNISAEIKNMMGALRYRYSFTQNQYFHCAEVGFLCGLLASELGVPLKDARRAGMLHDIGKAMDHSVDGGHAVIGADFIKQHGEADHIVHAVRAHHFDEKPETDLAYLVIAADAISGARPGARRSTAANYTQKINDLQTIARGFDGVVDTHVLSAGREIRVYVDGKRLDDLRALDLSRQIAHKIEADMQYPGQIRVTVVRETQAIEYAK